MNQKEIFFGMKQINRAITAVFCAMAACVLLLILFAFETTAFSGKVNFVLPQWSMMIIGLAVLFRRLCQYRKASAGACASDGRGG